MYAYLFPFQYDINIILLPYKKISKKSKKILYHSDVMLGFDNEIRMLCYILLRINLHCTLAL